MKSSQESTSVDLSMLMTADYHFDEDVCFLLDGGPQVVVELVSVSLVRKACFFEM